MSILSAIRKSALRFNVDVRRATPFNQDFMRVATYLSQRNISLVLDVGANDGGYASDLINTSYGGKIVSFEPLPVAHEKLVARAKPYKSRWAVFDRCALSCTDGHADFFISANSVSSSLKEMHESHVMAAPNSRTEAVIKVKTCMLDSISECLSGHDSVFLKLDVQGGEMDVLRGAVESLSSKIVGVQVELSLVPLYGNQSLHAEIVEFFADLGFMLWDIIPGFRDSSSYRLLQYDGIFFR